MIFLILILTLQCGVMAFFKLLGIAYDIEGLSLLFIASDCVPLVLIGLIEIKKKNLYFCYCAGFFIRLLLLFTDYYFIKIFHSGSDSEFFFQIAANGFDISRTHYFLALSAFFEIVGTTRLFAQFMNLCCGMLSCLIVLKVLERLRLNEKAQIVGFALICFLPNWVDMSVILLRESIIGVCVALALYYFVLWFEKAKLNSLIFAVSATLPAVFLHSGVVGITAIIVVSMVIYNPKTARIRMKFSALISLFGLAFLTIIFVDNYGAKFLPYLGQLDLTRLFRIQNYGIVQADLIGSIYLENLNASTWLEFIFFTPIRWLYFYFSPMPWDWRGISDIVAFFLSSAPTFFVFLYTTVAVLTSKHNRYFLLILSLVVITFGVVYSWGTVSAGTAMRHRDKIVPIYAVMLAASYDARLKRHLDYRLPKRLIALINLM